MFAGRSIVAFDKAAIAELGAGDADNHDALDDQRRTGHRVAVRRHGGIGGFRLPDLLAGLGVERDDTIVHQRADDHALVNRRATIDDAAADHAQRVRRIFVLDAPDLLAGDGVDGGGRIVGRHVDDAVVDDRKAFPALQIRKRIRPYRNQLADVVLGDLGEGAVAIAGIAHAVDQHIARCFLVVLQIVCGLGERGDRNRGEDRRQQCRQKRYARHSSPPDLFCSGCLPRAA